MQTATNAVILAGALIAVGSLFLTAIHTRNTFRTRRAQFWLDLRGHFLQHRMVHLQLRPGGCWATGAEGPNTVEDWAMVEAYMGLFEHCEEMLKQKLMDFKIFRNAYKYRLENIVQNEIIVREKLINEAEL